MDSESAREHFSVTTERACLEIKKFRYCKNYSYSRMTVASDYMIAFECNQEIKSEY